MTTFPELVAAELAAARAEHEPVVSLHHYHSVLLEEVAEFAAEVAIKPRYRSKKRLVAELVQVAAMCQRCVEDMSLLPPATDATHTNGAVSPQNGVTVDIDGQEVNDG